MISIDSDVAVEYQEQGGGVSLRVPKKITEEEISTRNFSQINIYINSVACVEQSKLIYQIL